MGVLIQLSYLYRCICIEIDIERLIDIDRYRYIDRYCYRHIDILLLVFSKDHFRKVCPSW